MNDQPDQQKSIKSPERISQIPVEGGSNGVLVSGGVIVFNQRPTLPADPITTLKQAEATGDTVEKRIVQFKGSLNLDTFEQKAA